MSVVLIEEFWPLVIVCSRMIGFFSWMPGLSETNTPFRVRMLIAIGISATFYMTLETPSYTQNSLFVMPFLLSEYITGVFLGLLLKVFLGALETAGTIMSQSIGLSNALVPNMGSQEQTSILNSFFTLAGITFIFLFDLHHLIFWGIYNSYKLIPIGSLGLLPDKTKILTQSFSDSFGYALRFAMPFFIFGNLVYLAMGILNKLIPQIQVFFLSMPLQILVGLVILGLSMSFILNNFLNYFSLSWSRVIGGG